MHCRRKRWKALRLGHSARTSYCRTIRESCNGQGARWLEPKATEACATHIWPPHKFHRSTRRRARGEEARRSCVPPPISARAQDWQRQQRVDESKAKRIRVCTLVGKVGLCFVFLAGSPSIHQPRDAPCYTTLSGKLLRRSLRFGVTMRDRARAATGKSSTLKRSRFRRRSVGSKAESLARAGPWSPS